MASVRVRIHNGASEGTCRGWATRKTWIWQIPQLWAVSVVPVAVPVAVPEEKPPAPLSRMPWRTPPPPPQPPPPPSQPSQPPQPQPSKKGRGGRGGRVGGGGGTDGGGGGGGSAASEGDAAGPVSFGFVLDARFRRGGEARWLLHHPSLPRPAGRRASAANLAAWRAARRATLLGMHPALAAWRGGGAPCGARYLLTLRVTNRSLATPQPAAAGAEGAAGAGIAARVAARSALSSSSCINYAWLDGSFRPLGRARLLHACMSRVGRGCGAAAGLLPHRHTIPPPRHLPPPCTQAAACPVDAAADQRT